MPLLSDLGDATCGFCVFRCCLHTSVQCSHRVGVSDHFTSAAAVCAQTQQEADFLLLASRCGWSLTTLHKDIPHVLKRIAVHVALLLFSRPQDVFNSVFAAAFFIVLNLMAVTSYAVAGSLVGGVRDISLIYNCNLSCVAQFLIWGFWFPPYTANKIRYPCNVFNLCARAVVHGACSWRRRWNLPVYIYSSAAV